MKNSEVILKKIENVCESQTKEGEEKRKRRRSRKRKGKGISLPQSANHEGTYANFKFI